MTYCDCDTMQGTRCYAHMAVELHFAAECNYLASMAELGVDASAAASPMMDSVIYAATGVNVWEGFKMD